MLSRAFRRSERVQRDASSAGASSAGGDAGDGPVRERRRTVAPRDEEEQQVTAGAWRRARRRHTDRAAAIGAVHTAALCAAQGCRGEGMNTCFDAPGP